MVACFQTLLHQVCACVYMWCVVCAHECPVCRRAEVKAGVVECLPLWLWNWKLVIFTRLGGQQAWGTRLSLSPLMLESLTVYTHRYPLFLN